MIARSFVVATWLIACISSGCSQTDSPPSDQPSQGPTASTPADKATPAAVAQSPTPQEPPAPPTEQELVKQVRALYAAGKFAEAEAQFADAREAFPDSLEIKELHAAGFYYLRRSNKLEESCAHLQQLTDAYMEEDYDRQGYADTFGWRLGDLAELADEIDGAPNAEDVFADYRSRADKVAETKPLLADIVTTQWAIYLSGHGRHAEARQLVEPLVTKAREQLASAPADAAAILGVADALEAVLQVESATKDGGDPHTARDHLLDFLYDQAQSHPQLDLVRGRFCREHLNSARSLAYTDPDAAAKVFARVTSFKEQVLAPLAYEDLTEKWKFELAMANRDGRVEKTIEQSRARFALIGTPAVFPDNADGWVGVDSPITGDQLRGKVVVLDFFAVWCGPCIATFPHLIAWHDEFSDDGLQIIGVSDYHSFDWDAEARRSKRVANLEPAAERLGMEKFAAHHGLQHAIAFVSDKELDTHYVVSGIPHVVLIDRAGKVRMHRIGSGEKNAADLEQAIKECLAEPVPSGAERS